MKHQTQVLGIVISRRKKMLNDKDWMIKQQNEQLYSAWTRIEEQRAEIDNLKLELQRLRREIEYIGAREEVRLQEAAN